MSVAGAGRGGFRRLVGLDKESFGSQHDERGERITPVGNLKLVLYI